MSDRSDSWLPVDGAASAPARASVWRSVAKILAIIVVCLIGLDALSAMLGVLPPAYNFGIPGLGWAPESTGAMHLDSCRDFEAGGRASYMRNEIGIRTTLPIDTIRADYDRFKIAVVGDSHTDLCAPNDSTHPGVLDSTLQRLGMNSLVLSYGMGRYSPLQAYLLFRERLLPLRPRALVLNLYTGNDFYDMMRPDDRPHFEADLAKGYRVAAPEWFVFDDPNQPRWMRQSRLLYLARSIGKATGIGGMLTRFRYLMATAAAQDAAWFDRLRTTSAYMQDLSKTFQPALGYPAAFAAQMLNQSVFFYHFPASRAESQRRIHYLMRMMREENPALELVMSPIPSYQLAVGTTRDSAFDATMAKMPFTVEEARAEEQALYDDLRTAAAESGWVFVDNLASLRAYDGPNRLYNGNDYHISRTASQIIGENEARTIIHIQRDSAAATR